MARRSRIGSAAQSKINPKSKEPSGHLFGPQLESRKKLRGGPVFTFPLWGYVFGIAREKHSTMFRKLLYQNLIYSTSTTFAKWIAYTMAMRLA